MKSDIILAKIAMTMLLLALTLPAAASDYTLGVFGAAFLVAADILAREIVAPVIIPVGIITSFVGGPLFLYLIIRKKKEYW